MGSAVQDIPNQEFDGTRSTGFPEPLSLDRNTTLPYPTADLSPTACIESSDVPIARSSSRLRFSSSRRLTAKGYIDPNYKYENIHYVDSTTASKPGSTLSKESIPESDDGEEFKSSSEERTSGETDPQEHARRKRKTLRRIFRKE